VENSSTVAALVKIENRVQTSALTMVREKCLDPNYWILIQIQITGRRISRSLT